MSLLLAFGVLKVDYRGKRLVHLLPIVLFQPVAYFLCETYGIQRTSSSEAGIIIALLPIVTVVVASVFLREPQPAGRTLSVLVSIAGAVLIVAMSGLSPTFDFAGYLLLFGAVLAAAAFNTLVRHQKDRFTAVEMTYAMMATGTLVFGGAAAAGTASDPGALAALAGFLRDPWVLAALGYLGLFSSILAFLLLNITVRRLGASRASSFANITTVVSIVAGTVVLHESLDWYHFVGSGLILAGVWGANRRAPERT
jgi:drug/metabolite transporter (DMT)-like permease